MSIVYTALELGLIYSLTVLALYLSYKMLNVCDLSTDGCFTLGATVGSIVLLSGHPYLAIIAALLAGVLSGLVTAFLQTKMGIDSLLSGIIVNTGLYSINIAIMGGSSLLNLNKSESVYTKFNTLLANVGLDTYSKIIVGLLFALLVILFLTYFLKTKVGLTIRATGNNPVMVKNSSINTTLIIIIGLCASNSFTALSGALLAFYQKSVSIDIGNGVLTIALASLLIGNSIYNKNSIFKGGLFAVLGSIIFRIVYMIALRLDMPAYMLKLVSSLIVIIAIYIPYIKSKYPEFKRRREYVGNVRD